MNRRLVIVAGIATVVVVAAVVGFVVLRGRSGPPPVVVNGRVSTTVEVPAGAQLHVAFGRVGTSIGDVWQLLAEPDGAVLRDLGQEWERPPECGGPGCEELLTWHFGTVRAGTTALRFQYCYRSRLPSCTAEPSRGPERPVTVTVTVV